MRTCARSSRTPLLSPAAGKLSKAGILALALSFSLTVPVSAGPREDAGTAYQRGDYGVAFRLWRPLAEQGDARAQAALGGMYNTGDGVAQDRVQAASWYRKAADQGLADAQTHLGLMYQYAEGVPRDYVQAVSWYRKAADQGEPVAQFSLGFMYRSGQGVPRDCVQAAS
jgi:TPR repeat protein